MSNLQSIEANSIFQNTPECNQNFHLREATKTIETVEIKTDTF